MVNVTRSLLVLSLLVGAPSFAASQATVGVKIAELRIKPDDGAFSRLKIPGGREVAVLGKSDDGRWIKVRTQIERGEDVIKLEGWLEVSQVKGADPSSLQVASGGESSGSSGASTWSDTSSSSSGDSWGSTETAAPAESSGWGDAPASSESSSSMGEWDLGSGSGDAAAPSSSDDSWDTGSSSDSSSSSSGDSWDSGSSSDSSSSGDSWDSGSSDSSSSGDSWDSGSSSDDGGW